MILRILACCFILFVAITLGGNIPSKKSKGPRWKIPNGYQCLYRGNIIPLDDCDRYCRSSNATYIVKGTCMTKRCYCEWNILGHHDTNFFYPLETCEDFNCESLALIEEATANSFGSRSTAAKDHSTKERLTHGYLEAGNEVDSDTSCHDKCVDAGKETGIRVMRRAGASNHNEMACFCRYRNNGCLLNEDLRELQGAMQDEVASRRWDVEI